MAQVVWGLPGQELRPTYGLYYMMSYQVLGLHPLGYHLISCLLHILNCVLILWIVKELTPQESWRGVFAALLFAVLPLHSQVFSWTTGAPAELIPDFFYLTAFLGFMRFRGTGSGSYFVITVLAFAGCLLSKQTRVTLPGMLISYDLLWKVNLHAEVEVSDPGARIEWWRKFSRVHVPIILLLLAYLVWRRVVFSNFLKEGIWKVIWQGNWRGYQEDSAPTDFLHHLAGLGQFFEISRPLTSVAFSSLSPLPCWGWY